MTRRERYTDNDHTWGPFLWAKSEGGRTAAAYYEACTHEDSDAKFNVLHLQVFKWLLRVYFPALLKPFRERHQANWDAATVARLGRNYYDTFSPRAYGFYIFDGHFYVYLGAQTSDSTTTQSWSCFLPWTQWRHVRQSWYGPDGEVLGEMFDTTHREVAKAQRDWRWEFEKTLPKVVFEFKDFDGEVIQAKTHIEEREWRFGTGWCKWLSFFRRPRVRTSLDIAFTKEVGPRKGSWKGGTIGHSTEVLPGELHEAAFRRYCATNQLTFVRVVSGVNA